MKKLLVFLLSVIFIVPSLFAFVVIDQIYVPSWFETFAGEEVYNGYINVVDPTTMQITNKIEVGVFPNATAFSSDAKYLYVSNRKSNSISVIDRENEVLLNTIPLTNMTYPSGLFFDENNNSLYVCSLSGKIGRVELSGSSGTLKKYC